MTGKELKSRLAKTGYSFADIAKMIGTTPQTLNQMFQSADVKTGYLEKIASALNLPVSALIEANGDVVAAIDHSTAIYIERDLRKVDAANRRIIDYVFNGKK